MASRLETRPRAAAPVPGDEQFVDRAVNELAPEELIAWVLADRGKRLDVARAADLLAACDGASGLMRATPEEIRMTGYADVAQARRLAAGIEIGRRAWIATFQQGSASFPSSAAVVAWAEPRLGPLQHEELWALALDGRHRLRAARRIALGGAHGLSLHSADALRPMLRAGATAFILLHNHPSGNPLPSREDLAFTRRMAAAAEVVGLPLLDHVIVTVGGWHSFLDSGQLT